MALASHSHKAQSVLDQVLAVAPALVSASFTKDPETGLWSCPSWERHGVRHRQRFLRVGDTLVFNCTCEYAMHRRDICKHADAFNKTIVRMHHSTWDIQRIVHWTQHEHGHMIAFSEEMTRKAA